MASPINLENPTSDSFFESLNAAGGQPTPPQPTQTPPSRPLRKRSNSRSRRNVVPHPAPPAPERARVQYTLILTSLNGTFEKKLLVIPYYPDVLKLGRPAGTKVEPALTNGYFDLRVLLRNHAQLFADVNTGKIYLKDLGSSNGTFVNEEKISADKDAQPTEINKGDVIDLGFDIESHQNHRKISARVENIVLRFLTENRNQNLNLVDGGVMKQVNGSAFDSALFGDVLPSFEDTLLGVRSDLMTGLSINLNLTTSTGVDEQIRLLTSEIHLLKLAILKNKLVEVFLKKYIKNLNKIEMEKNEKSKMKVKDYEQQLLSKYEKDLYEKKSEMDRKVVKLAETNRGLRAGLEQKDEELMKKSKELEDKTKQLEQKQAELEEKEKALAVKEAEIVKLRQRPDYIEKSVQTEMKRYRVTDNDSDSLTLNDDDIQRKLLSARSGLKAVYKEAHSDEDLGMAADRSDIITEGLEKDYKEFPSDTFIVGAKPIDALPLLARIAALEKENATLKDQVHHAVLSRLLSNVLLNSEIGLPIFGLFGPSMARNRGDLENMVDVGSSSHEEIKRHTRPASKEPSRVSVVTAIGIVVISYMVSRMYSTT